MPVPILYFHGFASSPASAKIAALRPLLEPAIELVTPDLNVPSFRYLDFEGIIGHAVFEGRRIAPKVIVGSSLGAIIALETLRRGVIAPLVLIAPALGIAERWRTKLPPGDPIMAFNHTLGAEVPIHRAFFLQMAEVHGDDAPPPTPVTVIMGRRDETVPFDCVERTWKEWEAAGLQSGSKFVEIAEGDHGLVDHTQLIAEEIRAAAAR